jgi:hypothetical protein
MADVVFPATESPSPIVPYFALTMHHLGRLPWAFILLALGILLAVGVVVLALMSMMAEALVAIIIAGVALLSGIVTLMVQNFRETRKLGNEPEQRPLQVYRQMQCPLDGPIYEKLVHSAKALEDTIVEKAWEYDEKAYQDLVKQAVQHFKHRRFRDAFREQCRAMLVLMEAVHSYRGKNEDFKPMWDLPAS